MVLLVKPVCTLDVNPSAPQGLTNTRALSTFSLKREFRRVHGVYGTPGLAYTNLVPD